MYTRYQVVHYKYLNKVKLSKYSQKELTPERMSTSCRFARMNLPRAPKTPPEGPPFCFFLFTNILGKESLRNTNCASSHI